MLSTVRCVGFFRCGKSIDKVFVSVVQCGGFKKIVSPTTTVHFCLRLYGLLPALAPKGLAAAGDGVLFYRQTVNEECLESVSALAGSGVRSGFPLAQSLGISRSCAERLNAVFSPEERIRYGPACSATVDP